MPSTGDLMWFGCVMSIILNGTKRYSPNKPPLMMHRRKDKMIDPHKNWPVNTDRLRELSTAVTKGRDGRLEFTIRVPAEPKRDADLVLSGAANEIDHLRIQITAANKHIAELEKWNREMVEKAASGGTLDGYREMAARIAELEGERDEAIDRGDFFAQVLSGGDDSLAYYKPGDLLPRPFGFICNTLIEAFDRTPEANNHLAVTITDKQQRNWTLIIGPEDKVGHWKGRAEKAEAEIAELRSAIDKACNALTDSICASGNDADTNLNWVRKLWAHLPPAPNDDDKGEQHDEN